MKAAALLELEAVRRAEAQMAHRERLMLTHTERLTDSTARERMLRLIHYHAVTKRFTNLLNALHTAPTSVHRPPRHHRCAPEERQPQHPSARGTCDTPAPPASHRRDNPAPPSPAKPAQDV